jgi:putative heme-binding domain-containing protein
MSAASLVAQEAQWIWSPEHEPENVPRDACHFRRSITTRAPERGQISVLADDSYEIFVNGRRVGSGESSEEFDEYDISRFLSRGRNLLAIKVVNRRGSTAGVAARVMIRDRGDDWRSYSTNRSWKTSLNPLPFWNTTLYNDSRWVAARELGRLGETAPWDVRENVAAEDVGDADEPQDLPTERFEIDNQFTIQQLLKGEETGSLIAVTFNEFGHLITSREGGPLLLIYDEDDDGHLDAVREYCTEVKNCQGILALNGMVFVTADGPEGAALYRLEDNDGDGQLEKVTSLFGFGEKMGEHGGHGLTLGPDGLIYVVVGNHSQLDVEIANSSPHSNYYEGDLIQPRHEDPSGHALGHKAPGGVVIRTDLNGEVVELVAGGLRNAYDLAFDRNGNLFVHDSDMESDMGTTWYRPTQLYHVTPGAEFGWRSGWAKWPDYYADVLPGILDSGRGSPTGAVFYDHFAFPTKYHQSLFLADWSEGRILAVKLNEDGASFSASSEVFLEGRPLNVTDLEVGPDGAIYFVTGGRGTDGGLYRIAWTGRIPDAVKDLGRGMTAAIRQPQMNSAWSRQKVAEVRQSLGENWGKQLRGVARSSANPWYYRTRALDLMQLLGPPPTAELLIRLSRDGNEFVRGKAVELMGLNVRDVTDERLIAMLKDPDRGVRRRVCEALLRSGSAPSIEALLPTLASDDRFEAWGARRLLERQPIEQWRDLLLESDNHRLVIQGSLALLIVHPNHEHTRQVIARFEELLSDFVTDRDFIDFLRIVQVALHRSNLELQEVASLSAQLGEEFPAGDKDMNRELIRLLAYLQVDKPMTRYMSYLQSDAPAVEKLHLALHLGYLRTGWTSEQKWQLIQFLERAKAWEGGNSFVQYINGVERDFGKTFTAQESREVLARSEQWPEAAVGALHGLPTELDEGTVTTLIELDQDLMNGKAEVYKPLRIGILAVLSRSGHPQAMEYLRYVWDNEPERRESVAMGLAQQPAGDNWDYLIKSLPILDGEAAREVLRQLTKVERVVTEPEPLRQVILRGLKLKGSGVQDADALLQHWSGVAVSSARSDGEPQMSDWQDWFSDEYPDHPPAELPIVSTDSKWSFRDLHQHLTSDHGALGSPIRGAEAFKKAECIKCHRLGNRGDALGPDLTSLSKRFMKKEVLEAIIYPSHIISDQYASKTIVTTGGRLITGLMTKDRYGDYEVLLPSGEKTLVPARAVDEIISSSKSVMPDKLLDKLTLEEISDLFAYLGMITSQNVARRQADGATR